MKRIVLLLILCCYFTAGFAQSTKSEILTDELLKSLSDQVDRKANKLCQYIKDIGSSRSTLTAKEKTDLILHEVPHLFWQFENRKMTTTSGYNGQYKRQKSLKQYFNNLKLQSQTTSNREIKYELFYDRIINAKNIHDLSRWTKLPDWDNCEVYRTSITFEQTYYVISHNVQYGVEYRHASRVIKEEIDKKSVYVYLIRRKDDNRNFALLGDVYMAERLND